MGRTVVTLIFFSLITSSYAQSNASTEDLSFYGDIMVNAAEGKHRERAAKMYYPLLEEYVSTKGYLLDNFAALDGNARVEYSEDSLLTIITWQLKSELESFNYGGYIIKEGLDPIPLVQNMDIDREDQYDIMSPSNWYGALYYNIKDFKTKEGETCYFLFGFNGFNKYDSFKVLDVLSFEGSNVTLGKELFTFPSEGPRPDTRTRLKLKYSSESQVSINYNENLGMIMYDHLISRMGQLEGQGVTSVPDGSYEGFIIDKGTLTYKEKLFDHIYETAPVMEKEEEKTKNIFGKEERKATKTRKS